jgi:hypothetical protein
MPQNPQEVTNPGLVNVADQGLGASGLAPPSDMLLRTDRHGAPAMGVDPLPVSKNTLQRYKAAGVSFRNEKAESFDETKIEVDEAWIYNCLQHTEDPAKILGKVRTCARRVRIFEWLNTTPMPGHPQTLTESLFAEAFEGWKREHWDVSRLEQPGLYGEYIALVVSCS